MPNKSDLLIEIGTEELPPKNLKTLMQSLAANIETELSKASLEFGNIEAFATPRRLAFIVQDLEDEQPSQNIERRGPALKAAVDENGNPTKAAQGFMKSCGVTSLDQLERLETEKGTWLVFKDTQPGEPLTKIIEPTLVKALKDLPIERRMRWGDKRHEFVRPVHWLVALYGKNVLPCSLFGIGASNTSQGHRFMSSGSFEITSPDTYVEELRQQHVIVSFSERRILIEQQLAEIADEEAAKVEIDEDLLDEVTALVEWPVALMGSFPNEFLKVPEEALISAMKEHQRYFHMTDTHGTMLARFITISNIISRNPDVVVSGNEKVILPRLTDARFFFDQDKKTSLVDKRERLRSVVFQSELGSYFDKTERVAQLARFLANELGADSEDAVRAAQLCKSDLVSDMVGEFPDLQGLMGSYYADAEGENQNVVTAIAEHYLPSSSGGALPSSKVSKCVAIADKLDTIAGMFGIGQPPTGSKDPFAIRRQTLGVIRMCVEGELDFNLLEAIAKAIEIHGKTFDAKPIQEYLVERLKNWYQEQGIKFDSIDSVVAATNWNCNLWHTHKTILALEKFRSNDQSEALVAANKRVANILKKVPPEQNLTVDSAIFVEIQERTLFDAITGVTEKLTQATTSEEKLMTLGELRPTIDDYFDHVMVMADDDKLKQNRLATLAGLRSLFLQVADISLLQD